MLIILLFLPILELLLNFLLYCRATLSFTWEYIQASIMKVLTFLANSNYLRTYLNDREFTFVFDFLNI